MGRKKAKTSHKSSDEDGKGLMTSFFPKRSTVDVLVPESHSSMLLEEVRIKKFDFQCKMQGCDVLKLSAVRNINV